jgi:hypothetical protein
MCHIVPALYDYDDEYGATDEMRIGEEPKY